MKYSIPDKDFEQEYIEQGCYHSNASGFRERFLRENYRMLANGIRCSRRILDVGCGEGEFFAYLSTSQFAVGIDASPTALRLAKTRSNVTYRLGSAPPLDFDDESFDAVVSSLTLQYIKPGAWKYFLSEVGRVLKPRGILCFSYPNAQIISRLAGGETAPDCRIEPFSLDELVASISESGFCVLRTQGTNLPVTYNRLPPAVRRLTWWVACWAGKYAPRRSYHFVLLAMKQ